MKNKPAVYLLLLCCMIAAFFMFTGGISDINYKYTPPSLSSFTLLTSSPVIYAKLPFSILAKNESREDKDCGDYNSLRELAGTLTISQGATVVGSSNFILIDENGSANTGFTGTYVDTVILNTPGTYTAKAIFYDINDPAQTKSTTTLTFTVGLGSEIPLSAGTYKLSSFTATCASGGSSYTYSNASASNTLVINADGLTASLGINMQMGASVLQQYPCLEASSYNYSASGNFSVVSSGGSKYFKIEYENSAFVSFNYTFDGTNLTLNYSKNGSSYELRFVKQ